MGVPMRRRLMMTTLGVLALVLAGASPAGAATAWQVVAKPPLVLESRLVDVAATATGDAWAVGYQDAGYGGPVNPPRPYALLHWDGATWSERVLSDDVGGLSSISAATATDVWTAGADRQGLPYAAHWNGSAWQEYHPSLQSTSAVLYDVAAQGGRALFAGSDAYHAAVLEWDGQRFTKATIPGAGRWYGGVRSVASAPDGAAFAVGDWDVDNAAYPEPMIVQRVGSAWRVATLPKIPAARLLSVWARSGSDAWAVGTQDYDSAPKPLILHWNGSSWQRVTAPVAGGTLAAVSGDSSGNLWVSGGNPVPPYIQYPGSLFLRYAAGRWSTVYGPKVDNSDPYLSGLANVPGTSTFWGVGAWGNQLGQSMALIEQV